MSNINDMIDTIEYHIENNMIMNIKRDKVDKNEKIYGFPLKLSNELLLITRVVDFQDDGCVILRLKDITDAYSKESNSLYEVICIKEGIREKAVKENPITEIENWKSVLKQLMDFKTYISIECELEDNELCFSIGKISKLKDDIVYFNHFGLDGEWEKEERKILIEKITCVGFNDNYASTFYKYLKCPF